MFDEFERGPIDSHDAYQMGLRSARCNGCEYARLRWELGEFAFVTHEGGFVNVYEMDETPAMGQGEPQEVNGRPVRYRRGFMAVVHSDECYNWQPPRPGTPAYAKGIRSLAIKRLEAKYGTPVWITRPEPLAADGGLVPLAIMSPRHMRNAYACVGRHVGHRSRKVRKWAYYWYREFRKAAKARGIELPTLTIKQYWNVGKEAIRGRILQRK